MSEIFNDKFGNIDDKEIINQNNKKLGDKIKSIRLSKMLKQTVIAKYLGCSKSTFCCYEKGKIKPPQIELLAEILGVSVNYLLDDTIYQEEKNKNNNEHEAFMERLSNGKIIELKYSDIVDLYKKGLSFQSLPNDIKAKMLQKGIFICRVEPSDFR